MEIPHHNQPRDLGLAPLGRRAEFGPFAIPLNDIHFKAFSSAHFKKSFLALPVIARFSSSHFLRSALRTTQGPTGLLPVLMKILLMFPTENTAPLQPFPDLWIVTWRRVLKR